MQWCIQVTILNKDNEEKIAKELGIGNRRRYRDDVGRLVFFKRIQSKTIKRYEIPGVKIS